MVSEEMLLPGAGCQRVKHPTVMWPFALTLLVWVCSRADCPPPCDCQMGNRTVVCRSTELSTVPEQLPAGTKVLDLSRNRIRSVGQGALRNLIELQELDLSENSVSDINPGAFSGLQSLRALRLSGNCLKTIWPGALASMPNLSVLDLRHNPLVLLLDKGFQTLPKLRHLELGEQLVHITTRAFAGLEGLQHLALGKANSDIVPTAALSRLRSLQTLTFSPLNAISLPDKSFQGLLNLRHLRMERWPRLASLSRDSLDSLNLTSLTIIRCNLTSVPTHSVGHLAYLQLLDLSHNPIAIIQGDSLEGLIRLRELRLTRCRLAVIQPAAFRGLGLLQALNVSGNRLTTLEKAAFHSTTALVSLGLDSNSLVCDCRLRWLLGRRGRLDWGTNQPVCASPESVSGRKLGDFGPSLRPGEFSCTRPWIKSGSGQVTVSEGQTVSLSCGAEGEPAPHVHWSTPGGRMLGSSDGESGRLRVLANSALEIRFAQPQDAGDYQCTASNPAGSDVLLTHLHVKGWAPSPAAPLLHHHTLPVVLTLGSACFLGVTGLCFTLLMVWSRVKGPIKRTTSVQVLSHPSGTDAQSEAIKYTTKML